MDEIWKPVEGFEEYAEVSSLGRIRTKDTIRTGMRRCLAGTIPVSQKRRGQILRPWIAKNGYAHIALQVGPTRTKLLVHRVIAKAFVPGGFEGAHVNHINGIKTDNRIENLEWTTPAENTRHQWAIGLITREKLGIWGMKRGPRGRLLPRNL